MSLKNWNELSLTVKRNPQKFFNYLAEELGLNTTWDDLTVIERRSRHKQYKIIQETVDGLPAWNELSPFERRNLKKLYRRIQIVSGASAISPVISYNVSVSVKDSEDNPLQGVAVALTNKDDSSKSFTGTSGKAGGCTIKPEPGEYIVTATKEGYADYAANENLVVSSNANLNITLTEQE